MNIFEKFILKGKNTTGTIGIGLANSEQQNRKILKAITNFLQNGSINIILYGEQKSIDSVSQIKIYLNNKSKILLKQSNNPESEIISDLRYEIITAAIRGGLDSNLFIKCIKNVFGIVEINRLALLESFKRYQFFFGPVGIDECNSTNSKITFIKSALSTFKSLQIKPRISILSGGRISDIGRDSIIDNSIESAVETVKYFKERDPKLEITHDEILIENAVQNESNLIIAPNGISGNLIYRTLVHLGGGKAYGAIYMNLDKAIIDTSRVGESSEISGAIYLALALINP